MSTASARRVLIVDDEDNQRTGLAAMVRNWGYQTEMAVDGQDALEKLATYPVQVIITDLQMPRLDGFGLLKKLSAEGSAPPTIVLTTHGSIENAVETVHNLGAFWFVEKPIQPHTLEVLLERAAQQGGMHRRRNAEVLIDRQTTELQLQQLPDLVVGDRRQCG